MRLIFALQRESGFATVLPAFFFTFFSKLKITLRSLCKIFPMLFFFYIPTYAKDSGRHICSSTDRSSPKSSISNAIYILSYTQTDIMKIGVFIACSTIFTYIKVLHFLPPTPYIGLPLPILPASHRQSTEVPMCT